MFFRDSRKRSLWHQRFLEFLGFYGIHPSRSVPYHPWSKEKVERPFAYLEDHFITNNRFVSFVDFYEKLKAFQEGQSQARKNFIITSNRPFEEWGEVFNDDVVAAAILERLLHPCSPFLIRGGSYRLKEIMGKNKE